MTNGEPIAPPHVTDVALFWAHEPSIPSPRLVWWLQRIETKNWLPNRRVAALGYYDAALYFGVYIWEYNNVLLPRFAAARRDTHLRGAA